MQPHLVRIYLDAFSVPTLQQMLHLFGHIGYDEEPTSYITTWERFNPKEYAEQWSNWEHITQNTILSDQVLDIILKKLNNFQQLELEVHVNSYYLPTLFLPLLRLINKNKSSLKLKELHLYEDGLGDYQLLYAFNSFGLDNNKMDLVKTTQDRMLDYTKTDSNIHYKLANEHELASAKYGWHWLYPTTYHMLKPEVLTRQESLQDLYLEIKNFIKKVEWHKIFSSLNQDRQEIILSLMKYDKKFIDNFKLVAADSIVFTGTNATSISNKTVVKDDIFLQADYIKRIKKKNSPLYISGKNLIFFKGHPSGGNVNKKIIKKVEGLREFPASMPMELLLLLNIKPKAICGMMSSSYYSLPEDWVYYVCDFLWQKIANKQERHDFLYSKSTRSVIPVTLWVGVVKEKQVILYNDLYAPDDLPITAKSEYGYSDVSGYRAILHQAKYEKTAFRPEKKLHIGILINAPEDYSVFEKTMQSLLTLNHRCTLVINEHSPEFEQVCECFKAITRKDIDAYTVDAVNEAAYKFDLLITPQHSEQGTIDLATAIAYYHIAQGDVGSLGTMPNTLQAIFKRIEYYQIIV